MAYKYVQIPDKYTHYTDSLYHYFDNIVLNSTESGFLKTKKKITIDLNSYLNKFPNIQHYLLICTNINLKSSFENINILLWFYLDIDNILYSLNTSSKSYLIIENVKYENNIITFDIINKVGLLYYYDSITKSYASNITFSKTSDLYNINNNILSIKNNLWKDTSKILGIAKQNNNYFIYPIKK